MRINYTLLLHLQCRPDLFSKKESVKKVNKVRGPRTRGKGHDKRKEFNNSLRKESSKLVPHNTTSVLAIDGGKYYECFECDDRSLTKQQHLRLFGKGYTLLRRGKPISGGSNIVRETSRTHRKVWEPD